MYIIGRDSCDFDCDLLKINIRPLKCYILGFKDEMEQGFLGWIGCLGLVPNNPNGSAYHCHVFVTKE